jgi:AraC-like DNA-binding protein
MLMLVTAGRGRHAVDFVEWPLAPGSLLFVRPGQVQQWHLEDDIDAQLVLIAPSTLPHRSGLVLPRELEHLALEEWVTCVQLDPPCALKIESALLRLRQDFDQFNGSDLDVSLIRHELMTLLLRIARQQRQLAENTSVQPVSRRIYRLFLQALETDFQQQHGLQHYARHLGYAESTLSRACVAAEGRSAKQAIDRRIALEAQRLLVHSTASVAEIAHQLGFSETTNFVKFFRRLIGVTPSGFRRTAVPPPRP